MLAGVASSLLARRFGAPLLLVFLLLGVALGVDGPGGISFADTHFTYLVGSLCLAVILFDGGLRTRAQQVRGAVMPSVVLASVGVLLTAALTSGKPLAVVCHAPAALLSTRIRGVSPFAGYRVTGFTNDEEEGVGLASRARWLLEDELKVLGVDFVRGDMWKPYTVVDRNLYTGQNPASAEALAAELLKVL